MSDVIYNISSGFFDSVNGDRLYSAGDMNKPYKRVIADGIFPTPQGTPSTDFQVVAVSGMSVAVLAGNAMIGARWAENTDDVGITIAGNSSSSPRIDSIFLHIDTGMDTRAAGVVYRQGTAAGTPTAPAMVQTDNITELRLADILVAPSAAIITQANITDQRGGSDCPWVAGLIQQVDTSALFDQYRAAYAEQQQDQANEWNTFMDHLARDYDISMSLRKHESTYTSTAAASLIPINIDGYDTTKDLLQVYINGIFAVEGTHYIVKSATQIQLTNAISAGQKVHFVIYKAVMGGAQPIIPTDEQVQDAVDAYMDAHPGALVVDPELSDTSTHAIQNKAVAEALAGVNGRLQRYSDGNVYILSNAHGNKYINENTGALSVYNGWTATDFLPCDGLDKLYVTATALSRSYNAFYSDADESTYISSFRVDVGENVVPVPTSAKYYRLSNTTEAMQNEIVYGVQKAKLITANEKLGNLFKAARATGSVTWEKGYYSDRGLPLGPSFLTCIRSLPSDFIFCSAGSTYQLLSVADGERLRVCRYSAPDESAFIERLTVTNAQLKTIAEDCYIRVYLFYTDNREFAEADWPTLINNFVLNAIQIGYVPQSVAAYIAGKVAEIDAKIPVLPSDWSDKIQTIQTAQGTKFTFAVQTDTHYYVGYGDNAAYNLKLLTNYVGFDFVANLGDISRGYSDETIDSPENMRAAMTDIMHRYVTDISCPFMCAMGNHEMNSMWVDQYGGEYFSNAELWGRLFRPSFNTNPKAVTQTGKMYYYTDFNDIRVIVLNTQDGANQNFGIGAEQLAWFRSVALDTNKWVLVMSHVPLINGWSVASNYVSSYADIVDALIAYKANAGKVIGCFAGHTHTKESQTVDGILHVTFRNGGNYAEAVMIDLENKTIGTVMLGASGDRSFSF